MAHAKDVIAEVTLNEGALTNESLELLTSYGIGSLGAEVRREQALPERKV